MNDIKKEIADLKTRIQELENQIAEPKKWSPVGGEYYICNGNTIKAPSSMNAPREFGIERPTKEQAERAAIQMRKFNRLLALRDELCGDDIRHVYELSFDMEDKKWVVSDIGCFKGV